MLDEICRLEALAKHNPKMLTDALADVKRQMRRAVQIQTLLTRDGLEMWK